MQLPVGTDLVRARRRGARRSAATCLYSRPYIGAVTSSSPLHHRADLEVVRELLRVELVLLARGRGPRGSSGRTAGSRRSPCRRGRRAPSSNSANSAFAGSFTASRTCVEEVAHGRRRLRHPRLDLRSRPRSRSRAASPSRSRSVEEPLEELHVRVAAAVREEDVELERGLAVLRVGDEREVVGVVGRDLDLAVLRPGASRCTPAGARRAGSGRSVERCRWTSAMFVSNFCPRSVISLVQRAERRLLLRRELEPVAPEVAERVGEQPRALPVELLLLRPRTPSARARRPRRDRAPCRTCRPSARTPSPRRARPCPGARPP